MNFFNKFKKALTYTFYVGYNKGVQDTRRGKVVIPNEEFLTSEIPQIERLMDKK